MGILPPGLTPPGGKFPNKTWEITPQMLTLLLRQTVQKNKHYHDQPSAKLTLRLLTKLFLPILTCSVQLAKY